MFSNYTSCLLLFVHCLSHINEQISATSFYPGCGDNSHSLASLDTARYGIETDSPTLEEECDSGTETEADWLDDDQLVESVDVPQAKTSNALALEVSS